MFILVFIYGSRMTVTPKFHAFITNICDGASLGSERNFVGEHEEHQEEGIALGDPALEVGIAKKRRSLSHREPEAQEYGELRMCGEEEEIGFFLSAPSQKGEGMRLADILVFVC